MAKRAVDERPMSFADVMQWNRDQRRKERGERVPEREKASGDEGEDTTRTPSGGSIGGASTTVTSADTAVKEGDLGSPQAVLNREAETSGTVENLQTGEAATRDPNPVQTAGADAIDVPADWEGSHWQTRVALAKRISGRDDVKADEANAIIAAEVERRG